MTGSLWHLAAAVALFLLSHGLTNRPALRRPLERRLGRAGFIAAYSVLSIAVLAWVAAAFAAAPVVVVWTQMPWMRWVPPVLMVPASVLIAAGMATPNPFSIGPGGRRYDPDRPGLLRLTRHPVLWGLALWAGAHMVPNGDVASLVLFAPLFALAVTGPAILDRARRKRLGDAEWCRLARQTARPGAVALVETGALRLSAGILLYLSLLAMHEPVIGVSPFP